MVTKNTDDKFDNKTILFIDEIKFLIENYNNKKIKYKSVKNKLTFYAKSSGFINNLYRKQAWNLLINSTSDDYSTG